MGLCLAAPLLIEKWAARRVLGGAEKRPPLAAILSGARAARLAAAAAAKRRDGGGGPATTPSSSARFPAVEAARAAASAPPRPVDLRRAQKLAAALTDFWAGLGHALAAASAVVVPCWVVWVRGPSLSSPVPGFVLVLCSIVASMKVASFGHCNADLRARAREVVREKSRLARAAARAAGGRTGGGSGRLRGGGLDVDDVDDKVSSPSLQQQQQQLLAVGGDEGAPGTPGRANDPQRLSAGGEGTTRRSRIGTAAAASSGDEQGKVFAAASRAATARAAATRGGEGLTPVLTTTAELSEEEEQEEQAGTEVKTKEMTKNLNSSSSPYPTYPANLTAGNLAYFVAAPTLVYQTGYPCSPGTRASTRRLLWCSFKLSVAAALQAVIWVSRKKLINFFPGLEVEEDVVFLTP